MPIKKVLSCITLTFCLILAGCGNSETTIKSQKTSENDKLTVFTTIYPLEDFTVKIGGDHVNVKSIYPPNVDAHSFEPSTKDMITLANSDLFIYTGVGIEGFVKKAVDALRQQNVPILKAATGIDLLESTHEDEHQHEEEDHSDTEHTDESEAHSTNSHHENEEEGHSENHSHKDEKELTKDDNLEEENHDHGDLDPHVWLDPILSIELARNIKNSLINLMPQHSSEFEANFNKLEEDLRELDQEFKTVIDNSKTKYLLVAHEAYGYWQKRYGIQQIAIAGLSPTQEPTQKGLQKIIEESKEHNIHYVIFEQNASPKVAKIIQKEIGAKSLTLHNLEAKTLGNSKQKDDYFSIMRENLQTIKIALND